MYNFKVIIPVMFSYDWRTNTKPLTQLYYGNFIKTTCFDTKISSD